MKNVILIIVIAISTVFSAQTIRAKVIGVKDGGTVVILFDGKPQTIRLAHIDYPEKSQAFGTKAKQFTSDFCFGKTVEIVIAGKAARKPICSAA